MSSSRAIKAVDKLHVTVLGYDETARGMWEEVKKIWPLAVLGPTEDPDLVLTRPSTYLRVGDTLNCPVILYGESEDMAQIQLVEISKLARNKFELLLLPATFEDLVGRTRLLLSHCSNGEYLKNLHQTSVLSAAKGVRD